MISNTEKGGQTEEKPRSISKFTGIEDNFVLMLLDHRGRILWSSDHPTDSKPPFYGVSVCSLINESDRDDCERIISGCIVYNRPAQFVLRAEVPPRSVLDKDSTNIRFTFLPADTAPVAMCLIASILPSNYDQFSDEDRQVLGLLAQDQSLKEIATKMDRSRSAIDSRIKSLKEKLRQRGIGGLVAAAIRLRLI